MTITGTSISSAVVPSDFSGAVTVTVPVALSMSTLYPSGTLKFSSILYSVPFGAVLPSP